LKNKVNLFISVCIILKLLLGGQKSCSDIFLGVKYPGAWVIFVIFNATGWPASANKVRTLACLHRADLICIHTNSMLKNPLCVPSRNEKKKITNIVC
jgi:hypothetical protein